MTFVDSEEYRFFDSTAAFDVYNGSVRRFYCWAMVNLHHMKVLLACVELMAGALQGCVSGGSAGGRGILIGQIV